MLLLRAEQLNPDGKSRLVRPVCIATKHTNLLIKVCQLVASVWPTCHLCDLLLLGKHTHIQIKNAGLHGGMGTSRRELGRPLEPEA